MAAADWPPPPTYDLPIHVDEDVLPGAEFSPIWLEWFLLLAQVLTAAGAGGGGIVHNLLSDLQGGTADEYYHLTADQHTTLTVVATDRVLGRDTAGTGDPEQLTASQVLDFIGSTRGAILYRGAAGWAILAPGTAGFVLTTAGAGADPSWTEVDTEPSPDDPHWEPVSNMNPASPELLFDATTGDVVMGWIS